MSSLRRRAWWLLGVGLAFSTERDAHANDPGQGNTEHTIIVGVGGAAELELGGGSLHPGGTVMVEWDAIENWLELEIGVSALSANRGIEAPVDLLVKKPFHLAPWAEFMISVGPEVVAVSNPTTRATYFGGQIALDFMFWPWGQRVGLWVEPSYDFVFRSGVEHGDWRDWRGALWLVVQLAGPRSRDGLLS